MTQIPDGKVQCKCGCGKVFKPFRHQVYWNTACRVRAWARKHPRVKIAVETEGGNEIGNRTI